MRVSYTKTEIADTADEVQHTIVREALRMTGLGPHMEIVTIGDVPAGTGMGSSSTLTVGLLNAMYAMKGRVHQPPPVGARVLPHRDRHPRQAHRAPGPVRRGVRRLQLHPLQPRRFGGRPARPVRRRDAPGTGARALILYTAKKRDADGILKKQSEGTSDKMRVLREMRDLASEMRAVISGRGNIDEFAKLMHCGWGVETLHGLRHHDESIDGWYDAARKAGAQGGKLLGAGGGGFLFLMAPPERHEAIREALGRRGRSSSASTAWAAGSSSSAGDSEHESFTAEGAEKRGERKGWVGKRVQWGVATLRVPPRPPR